MLFCRKADVKFGDLGKRFSVVAILVVAAVSALAQPRLGRTTADVDPAFERHLAHETESALSSYTGEHSRQLRQHYEDRETYLKEGYAAARYLRDPYWQAYVDGLYRRIASANPEVGEGYNVFVARSPAVNAASYGHGVISLDLGLLARCHSDGEVAFVLCHELAHQVLAHADRRVHDYLARLYSEETQRTLRRRKRGKEGSFDELAELRTELLFSSSRHSRFGERAADSLGAVFYRNAGFAAAAPANVMRVLAKADSSAYAVPLDVAAVFGTYGVEVQERWLTTPAARPFLAAYTPSEATRDSLRTHPETATRRVALARAFGVDADDCPVPLDEGYAERRAAAQREIIAANFDAGRLNLSLYDGLRALATDADDHWARGVVALTLVRLAEARESLQFSRVLTPPSYALDDDRQALTDMLNAMRRTDLSDLAWAFAKTIPAAAETPASLIALARAANLQPGHAAEARAAAARFRESYPNHDYTTWL